MKKSANKIVFLGFLAFILLMPTSAAIVNAETPVAPERNVDEVVPSPAPNMTYFTVTPCRILDTRFGTGGIWGPVAGDSTIHFYAAGVCGVPFPDAKAVHVNIAAVYPAGPGYLTAWAYGTSQPTTSVLNFGAVSGLNAISNAATVPICESSCWDDMSIYTSRTTHIVVDVMGYFVPQ